MTKRLASSKTRRDREEMRWRMAADYADVGVWDVDLAKGTSYYSPGWKRMLGYEAHELTDSPGLWLEFMHPDDHAPAKARVDEMTAGRVGDMEQELRMRHRDGRWIWVLDRGRVVARDRAGRATRLVGVHIDITAQKEATKEIQLAHRRLELALEASGIGLWHYEPATNRSVLDAGARAIYGFSPSEEVTLDGWRALIHPDDREIAEEPARKLVPNGPPIPVSYRILRHDGAVRQVSALTRYTLLDDGTPIVVGIVRDVTQEHARQQGLAHAARHDALTGVLNRGAFDETLAEALTARRPDQPQALFCIDLDRFKMVNDSVGHAAGDAILKLVAQAMRAALPSGARIGRRGGDEFTVLADCPDSAAALALASRMIESVREQRLLWQGQTHRVGASIGVAMLADVEADAVAALSSADAACYAAKSQGRSRAVLYAPDGQGQELAGARAASNLLEALNQGRLVLYAQEIRDLFDAQAPCSHIEVLARLSSPDGSIIPPHRFIPAAERFDLMAALDRRVIRHALEELAASGVPARRMTLSINLSAASLSDDSLWPFVAATMNETGVVPQALCFEITETAAVANFDAAERFVQTAQAAGCRISLDDFGSGLSSFAYLKRFPVDSIKIDGTFVEEVGRNPFDQAICGAIGTIAAGFGVDVVAERIEDPAALPILRARGISHGQGFLLHRPEPLVDLLARRRPLALVS